MWEELRAGDVQAESGGTPGIGGALRHTGCRLKRPSPFEV